MGRKHRTHEEIKATILTIAKSGTLKTRIMYKSNLSYSGLCRYLNDLEVWGFLEVKEIDGQKIYITTKLGKEWLNLYQQLKMIK